MKRFAGRSAIAGSHRFALTGKGGEGRRFLLSVLGAVIDEEFLLVRSIRARAEVLGSSVLLLRIEASRRGGPSCVQWLVA